jgi:Epoxide hydrolase N terminus
VSLEPRAVGSTRLHDRASMTTDVHSPRHVADAELDDLRPRLARGRWPTAWPVPGWQAGTDPVELARLVDYWRTGYDWRAQETAINALPSHFVDIDGNPVHFLRYEGEHPDALAIVLTHGWPSSFLEIDRPCGSRWAGPTRACTHPAAAGRASPRMTKSAVEALRRHAMEQRPSRRPGVPHCVRTRRIRADVLRSRVGRASSVSAEGVQALAPPGGEQRPCACPRPSRALTVPSCDAWLARGSRWGKSGSRSVDAGYGRSQSPRCMDRGRVAVGQRERSVLVCARRAGGAGLGSPQCSVGPS